MSQNPEPESRLNLWEISVAGLLALLGIYLVIGGVTYGVGTPRNMGAGYFPVAIGGALAIVGLAIMIEARRGAEAPPRLPWRALACVTVGLVLFAVMITPLGAIPAIFFLVFVTMIGDSSVSWKQRLIISATIAVFGYVFFGVLFRLNIAAFW